MQQRWAADVVIPRVNGFYEPLFAAYRRSCAEPIQRRLERGERRVVSFHAEVRVHVVEHDVVRRLDPRCDFLVNINTLEDLQDARGGGNPATFDTSTAVW
jgi:molybdopterin-guanine dinucleotide biosynthesis protein A